MRCGNVHEVYTFDNYNEKEQNEVGLLFLDTFAFIYLFLFCLDIIHKFYRNSV